MSIFEVKGRQLELLISLPITQPDDVFELLLSKENVQNTSQDNILLLDFLELFLDDFSFFLVLVLHLKDLLGCCFIFPS